KGGCSGVVHCNPLVKCVSGSPDARNGPCSSFNGLAQKPSQVVKPVDVQIAAEARPLDSPAARLLERVKKQTPAAAGVGDASSAKRYCIGCSWPLTTRTRSPLRQLGGAS